MLKIHPKKSGGGPLLDPNGLCHLLYLPEPFHQVRILLVEYLVAIHQLDYLLLLISEHELPGPWLLDFRNGLNLWLLSGVQSLVLAALIQQPLISLKKLLIAHPLYHFLWLHVTQVRQLGLPVSSLFVGSALVL